MGLRGIVGSAVAAILDKNFQTSLFCISNPLNGKEGQVGGGFQSIQSNILPDFQSRLRLIDQNDGIGFGGDLSTSIQKSLDIKSSGSKYNVLNAIERQNSVTDLTPGYERSSLMMGKQINQEAQWSGTHSVEYSRGRTDAHISVSHSNGNQVFKRSNVETLTLKDRVSTDTSESRQFSTSAFHAVDIRANFGDTAKHFTGSCFVELSTSNNSTKAFNQESGVSVGYADSANIKTTYLNLQSNSAKGKNSAFAAGVSFTKRLTNRATAIVEFSHRKQQDNFEILRFETNEDNELKDLTTRESFTNFSYNTNMRSSIRGDAFNKRFTFIVGGLFSQIRSEYDREDMLKVPAFSLSKFLPDVTLKYTFSHKASLTAIYKSEVIVPSMAQLNPTVDSTNINSLRVGNQNLKAEVVSRFRGAGRWTDMPLGATLSGSFQHNIYRNRISTAITEYDPLVRVYSYANVNGAHSTSGAINVLTPIMRKRASINIGYLASNQVQQLLFDGITLASNQSTAELYLRFNITSRPYNGDLQVSYKFMGARTVEDNFAKHTKIHALGVKQSGKYDLDKHISISYNAELNALPSNKVDFSHYSLFMDANVSYSFGKRNQYLLLLTCYDILDQQVGFSRFINGFSTTETLSNTLGRSIIVCGSAKLSK